MDNDQRYTIDRLFTELALRYDLPKGFALRSGYRYGQRWGRNAQHRIWGNVSYTPDLGKHWELKLTAQLQTDFVAQRPLEPNFRPQLDLAYRARKKAKLIPELNADLFYRFDYRYQTIERFRISAGFVYRLHKNGDISLKYTQQHMVNIGIPQTDHILNIAYDIGIEPPKRKKVSE